MKLAIIGSGNMGSAIARGAIAAGILHPGELLLIDVDPARLEPWRSEGVNVSAQPSACGAAQQILLAVKPQSFSELAKALRGVADGKVVISIMAGVSSRRIRSGLGTGTRIVRAMPNTPCQIGAGITAIALGDGAEDGDQAQAQAIFTALGKTVMVDESHMHAVTAVSGSGPAYVFLLAEAMQQAAIELGIPSATARELAEHTVAGAGRLLVESPEGAAALRQAVTSPGGTTAAALKVMFEKELPQTISEALLAARDRGLELERG